MCVILPERKFFKLPTFFCNTSFLWVLFYDVLQISIKLSHDSKAGNADEVPCVLFVL